MSEVNGSYYYYIHRVIISVLSDILLKLLEYISQTIDFIQISQWKITEDTNWSITMRLLIIENNVLLTIEKES